MYGDWYNLSFVFLISLIYSLIEIEIEGKDGWMVKIPTPGIIKLGDKNLTIYHIYMIALLIVSVIFQNNMVLTINSFLYSASNVLLILFLEDILWFVFNPYFTIKKYKKDNIWWHSKQPWLFGIPMHNFVISVINLVISYITSNIFIFYNLLFSYVFIGLCILVAPVYHLFYISYH